MVLKPDLAFGDWILDMLPDGIQGCCQSECECEHVSVWIVFVEVNVYELNEIGESCLFTV